MKSDDLRLVAECLAGRREAFAEIVGRYQHRLYNAAMRLVHNAEDAADVVQETFLNAYQSLDSFKGDSELFTWLYRIAFNAAISLKRKQKNVASLSFSPREGANDVDDPSEFIRPGQAVEKSEEQQRLRKALFQLSPDFRDILIMKDLEGLKYEVIADLLRIPIGTVRSRLHRARIELRHLLSLEEAPEWPSRLAGQERS